MRALDRNLVRDLRAMKGQSLAIAMVVAGGVATYMRVGFGLATPGRGGTRW